MRRALGARLGAMRSNASRLQASSFLIATLLAGCSKSPDPIAAPTPQRPPAAEAKAQPEAPPKEQPALVAMAAAATPEPKPLARRRFTKKPKPERIDPEQLAGKRETVKPVSRSVSSRKPVVEETITLDDPEERLDPNDPYLSDREFYRTVHDWPGFSECLAKERTRREIGSGALRLLYKIGPEGNVLKVKAITPTGDGALALVPCVEKKAAKMRFSPLTDSTPVKKIAKFVWVANDTTVDIDRGVRSL
jgi:hypothetical protein